MLDLRFLWDDSSPALICCSGGLRYILLQASVVHHLPVVSNEELYALLRAIHLYTETGQLWDARQWSQQLGRKLSLYHWGTTTTTLPKDHEEFVEDPQVNFLSVHAPLPSSPLTTTTVVIQDLDDEDDSRQESKTKGKDQSSSTTASQGAILSDLPTTCYHLKGTSANSAQNDSLKSSLSLLAPRRKTRVRRHQLMTASSESRHCLLLPLLPTTFQQLLLKVAPWMIATRVLSHLALTILRLLPPQS